MRKNLPYSFFGALLLLTIAWLPLKASAQTGCAAYLFFQDSVTKEEFYDVRTMPLDEAQKINVVAKVEPSCPKKNVVRVTKVNRSVSSEIITIIPSVPYDGKYHTPAKTPFDKPGEYEFYLEVKVLDPSDTDYDPNNLDWEPLNDQTRYLAVTTVNGPGAFNGAGASGSTNAKPANNAKPAANNGPAYTVAAANFDDTVGSLRNLIGSADSVPGLLVYLMKILMILLGSVAVVVILVGAFRMVMSQGNAESLKGAKNTVTWAIIGLVVALLSYSIVAILQSFLGIQ